MLFSFPPVLILLLPLGRLIRKTFFCLALAVFLISDIYTGIQGFLYFIYDSNLYSGFILESVANTSPTESKEYLLTLMPQILLWIVIVASVFVLQSYLAVKLVHGEPSRSKLFYGFTFLIVGLSAFGWYQRAWRAHYPPVRLLTFYQSCEAKKEYWKNIEAENLDAVAHAKEHIVSVETDPRTIVLVVGESVNRENMSLYGYKRNTTPRLDAKKIEDKNLYLSKYAYSSKASTVAAFNDMFEFSDGSKGSDSKLFAYFRAAGYQIYWISNQDDLAIKAEFQDFSHQAVNLNRISGRSSTSMDEKVLPELEKALAEPAEKKLIVVHLIGIHPHFSFRYPSGTQPSWEADDSVRIRMQKLGRSLRTLELLEHYDKAMLYQDQVVSRTLALTEESDKKRSDVKTSWIFLSDHSVETGRRADRVGHSNKTISGYTIPFLFWTQKSDLSEGEIVQENASFRSDWLSYFLLDLAGIRCNFPIFEKSWLSHQYKWIEPKVVTELKKKEKEEEAEDTK